VHSRSIAVDSGHCELLGETSPALSSDARERIGYVPQSPGQFPWLSGQAMLRYISAFYPRFDWSYARELAGRWKVALHSPIGVLSPGQQQRLSIVRALATRPDVLILDEPIASLDPDPVDAFVAAEVARVRSWRTIPARLALGLGYSERPVWKSVARGVAVALAILFVWHLIHGSKPAALAYWWMTGACCFALVGRLQALLQAWMRSSVEQGLLRLAPGWPAERAIKRGVVLSTLLVQVGSIASWAAITVGAMLLGWIEAPDALTAGTAICATSLGFTGSAWMLLSHRRVREWRISTVTLVLLVGAGAVICLLGHAKADQLLLGWGLMVLPPSGALAWYWIAPLRFPLDVDPRALKAAR
jgi:hypothetical protein